MNREAILALLAAITDTTDLSDEQIAQAEADLLAAFDAIRAGDVEDVDTTDVDLLSQIADGIDSLRAVAAERIDAAAEREAAIAALADRVAAAAEADDTDTEADDTEDGEPEAETTEAAEPEAETTEDDTEAEREPVTAGTATRPRVRPSLTAIRDRAAAPTPPPASGPGFRMVGPAGQTFDSFDDVVSTLAERINSDLGSGNRGPFDKVRVARSTAAYAADRILDGTNDLDRIEAVTAPKAVVASGGFCAPAEVNYDIPTVGSTARPVRDQALARFQAARGSVQLPDALTLADMDTAGADASVGQWTNTTDTTPGASTKPYDTIDCGSFTTYTTYAVTKRLRFGNFGARAFPEQVTAWTNLVGVAHARFAEGLLLDAIKTLSTATTQAQVMGASRDLAETIIRAAVAWRSRHRAPDTRLRVLLPWWVPMLGSVDLMRGADAADVLADLQGTFSALVANAGVNTTYYVDGPSTGTSQVFGAQGAGALGAWPATVQWALYDEGHFLFLDGGTLDLGTIRDSTLNDTNDAELFSETFEGVGKHGVEALWVTSTVCPTGEFQIPVDVGITCGS